MTITIHLGQPKTGTSALQTQLAKDVWLLKSQGLHYPKHSNFVLAKSGSVTSGNGLLLLEPDYQLLPDTVYSSELLLFALDREEGWLEALLKQAPTPPHFVIYARNFYELAQSRYCQKVDMQNYVDSFEYYITNDFFNGNLKPLLSWIKAAQDRDIRLSIFNYSIRKKNFIEHFYKNVLNLSLENFQNHPFPVNRTLSMAERQLKELFNRHAVKRRKVLTLAWTNNLPDIESNYPRAQKTVWDRFVETHQSEINFINSNIPTDEAIDVSYVVRDGEYSQSSNDRSIYCFSKDQLEFIAVQMSQLSKEEK